jgi:hypothetical protein
MAMGAILGIAAFGRTQEKIAGANNGGITPPAPSFSAPASTQTQSFGSATLGNNSMSTAPVGNSFGGSFGSPATTAGGKKIVPQDDQPML